MPRYWLTVHWPHPVNPSDDCEWFVYLQHAYKAKGKELLSANADDTGDMVVFYETARGKPHRRAGSNEFVRLKRGRQAVIGIAEVSGPLQNSTTGLNLREYADEEQLNWAWEVPCKNHRWGRDVQDVDVLNILGRGNMRIRSGLIEIDKTQFDDFRRRLGV